MKDIEDNIIEIQTKQAFQDETIDQLNEVIIKQQNAIDKLQRQMQQLGKKIEEESQYWQQESAQADEKPPHY